MGEYRRFVSYLYEYQNEKKEKIAGAVRVDCRGSRTQIRVDVRESRNPGQAVLLGCGVPAQPLGRVLRSAGAGGERFVWRPESGQPEFAAYSGLEIRYEDSAFCLRTFWDDRIAEAEERAGKEEREKAEQREKAEIEQREKEEAEQRERKKIEQEEKAEAEQREKKETEKREKKEVEEREKEEPEQREHKESEQKVADKEARAEPEQSVVQEEPELSETEAPEQSVAEEEKEVPEQQEEKLAEQKEEGEVLHTLSFDDVSMEEPRLTWEELSRIYPSVRPFGEEDSWEVLRIRLQDIGRLPREYWGWGSCPFVEMAFQDHGSLLLLRDPASEQIYLGVPGTLPLQEFKVAELFGFRWHREGRDTGYYLARINL